MTVGSPKTVTAEHRAQRRDQLGAIGRREDRPSRPLEGAHRGVVVHGHDQHVGFAGRGFEVADVADVQQVEDAVGERHGPAGVPRLLDPRRQGLAREHRGHRSPRPHRPAASPAMARPSSRAVTVAVPRFITTSPPA